MLGDFPIYKWKYKWWVKKEVHTNEKKIKAYMENTNI